MKILSRMPVVVPFLVATGLAVCAEAGEPANQPSPESHRGIAPVAIAAAADGKTLYIASAAASSVIVLDQATAAIVRRIELPGSPSGLALSHDGTRLLVTCGSAASQLCEIETASGKILGTHPAGYFAGSPVLAPDGKTLYVCNRFEDAVNLHDMSWRCAGVHCRGSPAGRTGRHCRWPPAGRCASSS